MRQRTIDNSVSSLLKILFHMGNFSKQFRLGIARCLEPQHISNIFVCKELHETNVVWFQAPRDEWLDNMYVQQFFTANLVKLANRCGVIKVLNFSLCNNLTNNSVLSITCHCAKHLKILSLANCSQLTDASVAAVAEHCTQLEVLVIGGNEYITDGGITKLAVACTKLQYLCLNNMRITNLSLIKVAQHCTQLVQLNINNCFGLSKLEVDNVRQSHPNPQLEIQYNLVDLPFILPPGNLGIRLKINTYFKNCTVDLVTPNQPGHLLGIQLGDVFVTEWTLLAGAAARPLEIILRRRRSDGATSSSCQESIETIIERLRLRRKGNNTN